MANQVEAYSGFCKIEQLGLSISLPPSPDGMLVTLTGLLQALT